jgi:hypothetical protein
MIGGFSGAIKGRVPFLIMGTAEMGADEKEYIEK